MINAQFCNYVHRSRVADFFSSCVHNGEFVTERIPSGWFETFAPQDKVVWNQAIKFLYEKGTQRYDSTFDYLQVLSLGLDRDTRILLSVETFPSSYQHVVLREDNS